MSIYYTFPECSDGGYYLVATANTMISWRDTYWTAPGGNAEQALGNNFRNNVWENTCGGSTQMKTLWRSTVGTDVGGCGEPNIPMGSQSSHFRVFVWISNYVTSGYQDESIVMGGNTCMFRVTSLPPGYTEHITIPESASPPPPPVPPLSPPPYSPGAGAIQDPHLSFANGAHADFRGSVDGIFNFLTYPRLSVNVRTQQSTFRLRDAIVNGTFLTEVSIVARSTNGYVQVQHSSNRANHENWGWTMVNGSCNAAAFYVLPHRTKHCGTDFKVDVDLSTSTVSFGRWTITMTTNRVYNHISGAAHRIDLKMNGPRSTTSHGIIGQSFNRDIKIEDGKRDVYPKSGTYETSAQAEGSIQGDYTMYQMPHAFATDFVYSKFNTEPVEHSNEIVESNVVAEVDDVPVMPGA